jgi:hypothetical protein
VGGSIVNDNTADTQELRWAYRRPASGVAVKALIERYAANRFGSPTANTKESPEVQWARDGAKLLIWHIYFVEMLRLVASVERTKNTSWCERRRELYSKLRRRSAWTNSGSSVPAQSCNSGSLTGSWREPLLLPGVKGLVADNALALLHGYDLIRGKP